MVGMLRHWCHVDNHAIEASFVRHDLKYSRSAHELDGRKPIHV